MENLVSDNRTVSKATFSGLGSIIAVIDDAEMHVPDTMENTERRLIAAWVEKGNTIAPYVPPAPTPNDVAAERDRRLTLGFNYNFGDARGIHHFNTTAKDMEGWDLVTKLKDSLLQSGDTTSKIKIMTGTGVTEVTAPEWNAVLLYAGLNFQQPLWQASFILQAMNPIPADYATNPSYWPA